jgi:bacillolysin
LPKIDAEPEIAAKAALKEYADEFGIRDPFEDLQLRVAKRSPNGNYIIKFWQVQEGVRVYGGELVVEMDEFGRIFTINGEISPAPPIELTPTLTSQQASELALSDAALKHGITKETIEADEPQLYVYNPALFDKGENRNLLVWGVNLYSVDSGPFASFVLVDAHDGSMRLDVSRVYEDCALPIPSPLPWRWIYDNENSWGYGLPGNGPVRIEGQPETGEEDADNAYEYLEAARNYYWIYHCRNSYDGSGAALESTVRHCPSILQCPWPNASWEKFTIGQNVFGRMAIGQGYAVDDVVGHEFTHGVTNSESGLAKRFESGAINESFSDIWGEFIDIYNANGDLPGDAWLHGEDHPGGPDRSLSNPPQFGDPDKVTSPYYCCVPESESYDFGGIHTNSGVNNKAAYLMYSYGLTRDKIAKIYYEAQTNILTANSDYFALYEALKLACTRLSGLGLDCSETGAVRKAIDGAQMYNIPCVLPDIRANGQQGPIYVPGYQNVMVEAKLEIPPYPQYPSYQANKPADFWVARERNGVYYYLNSSLVWTTQPTPIARAVITYVPYFVVYNAILPSGKTTFYLAVDFGADGVFQNPWRLDSVVVNVQ